MSFLSVSGGLKLPCNKISNSSKETNIFAKELAKHVKPFCFIALIGELGAGKTAFVRGFSEVFGVDDCVFSPTFSIINEYVYDINKKIVHCDMYRVKDEEDLYCTGFFDFFYDENVIILAEWAQKILKFLPKNHIKIQFKVLSEHRREIRAFEEF